jgi:hypothetical protein
LQVLAQIPVPAQGARTVPRTRSLTVTHFPRWFGSAQAWHWPVQADSQQTPSTHLLD